MKKVINSKKAPAPIGPYNQGIVYNGILYTSGQIALDAESGEIHDASIEQETEKVMQNLQVVLEEAGTDFSKVLKTSIFLSDMNNFKAVNQIYSQYFEEETAPARETVQVAALPKSVNVEISMLVAVE